MNCFFCNSKNATIDVEVVKDLGVERIKICKKCCDLRSYEECCNCNILLEKDCSYRIWLNEGGCKFLCCDCKKNLNICESCGNVFERDTSWCLCYDCRNPKYIRDYFYKPEPIFYQMKDDEDLFIGIEYEIGGGEKSNAEKFLYEFFKNPHVYSKYDTSIPNYGFEIVSHPATAMAHKSIMPWRSIFERLKELDIQSTDNCGIHFHVNRSFFEDDNIRTADFIVNEFSDLMSIAGERAFNRYCIKRSKTVSCWGRSDTSEHHDSLNLTSKNTLEFRFFKSTTDIENLMNKVDFIKHLCYFIKSHNFNDVLKDIQKCRQEFKEYMRSNTNFNF